MMKYAHVDIDEGRIVITNKLYTGSNFSLRNFVISKDRKTISGETLPREHVIYGFNKYEFLVKEVEPEFVEEHTTMFLRRKIRRVKQGFILLKPTSKSYETKKVVLKRVPPWTVVEISEGEL